jgi:hypothetical protein
VKTEALPVRNRILSEIPPASGMEGNSEACAATMQLVRFSLNQVGDDREYLLRAALQRVAPDALVGLVRLIEIAGPTDQRNHPGPREPSAVRCE